MNKRSMGGRIYQQRTFRPKSISLNNPQQRKLHYPIKGDTSFDPQQYGKKHYLSPKHSAIHSIIFNENYNALMKEKYDIIQKLTKNKNQKFDQKVQKQKIKDLNNYLNEYVRDENKNNNHSNPLPPFNNFNSQINLQSNQRRKGNLYRQSSMNEVLKPYTVKNEHQDSLSKNMSSSLLMNKYSTPYLPQINRKPSLNDSNIMLGKDFPRYINPNNLNSIF